MRPDWMKCEFDFRLLSQAQEFAGRSPDPSTKVGAIVAREGLVLAAGWNDLVHGTPEHFWEDREKKYDHVIHAEEMVLLSLGVRDTRGCTLYVNQHPCHKCARLIVKALIHAVVCPGKPWRDDPDIKESVQKSRDILDRAGVEVRYV